VGKRRREFFVSTKIKTTGPQEIGEGESRAEGEGTRFNFVTTRRKNGGPNLTGMGRPKAGKKEKHGGYSSPG